MSKPIKVPGLRTWLRECDLTPRQIERKTGLKLSSLMAIANGGSFPSQKSAEAIERLTEGQFPKSIWYPFITVANAKTTIKPEEPNE